MKRDPGLRDLSEDHHHGLVLARRARRAAEGIRPRGVAPDAEDLVAATWALVVERFERDLAPHFGVEEHVLVPLLFAAGETALTARLADEHAALRAAVAPGADRSGPALARFGELLEAHIRFEERVLFERAQAVLPPDDLAAVGAATAARPPRSCDL